MREPTLRWTTRPNIRPEVWLELDINAELRVEARNEAHLGACHAAEGLGRIESEPTSRSEESPTDSSSSKNEGILSNSKHMLKPPKFDSHRSKSSGPNSPIAQSIINGVRRRNWYISVVRWIKTWRMSCGTTIKM